MTKSDTKKQLLIKVNYNYKITTKGEIYMAKNFYDDDALKVLIGILAVASLIAIFLVKWAI